MRLLALISYSPEKRRRIFHRKPEILPRAVLGMRVMCAAIGSRRGAEYIAREFQRLRVDCVCFSEDFPFRGAFPGFREADKYNLVAALLPETARKLSDPRGIAYLYSGGAASRENAEILETLCLHNRWVFADTRAGGAIGELSRTAGVSVVENPGAGRILSARLAVFTAPPERETELSRDCVALARSVGDLDGVRGYLRVTGVEVRAPESLEFPERFPQDALLAESVLRGGVPRGSLAVMNVLTNG